MKVIATITCDNRRAVWRVAILVVAVAGAAGAAGQSPASAPAAIRETMDRFRVVVDAVWQSHRATGIWPRSLDGLSISDLAAVEKDGQYVWRADAEPLLRIPLSRAADSSSSFRELVYVFGGHDEGWYVRTESGRYEPLDWEPFELPGRGAASSRPVEEIARELERRIAQEPGDAVHRAMLVTALVKADRRQEARDAALEWVRAFPRQLQARWALFDTERKLRTGLDRYDPAGEWEKRQYSTFAAWRLIHTPFANTSHGEKLDSAIRLPVASGEIEWYIAEPFLYEVAEVSAQFKHPRRVIDVCDIWQVAAEKQTEFKLRDRSYFAFRGAAHLVLGEMDKARADAEAALDAEKSELLWSGGARGLLDAVRAGNRAFEYEPRRIDSGEDWRIAPR